jgi:hypothetical protein
MGGIFNDAGDFLNAIEKEFNSQISFNEVRPGIHQLCLPVYYNDGDMVNIFLVSKGGDKYELCDFGQTLMRLSYSFQIDPGNKESILRKILFENQLTEEDGNIKFETELKTILPDIMHIIQAYMKIDSILHFNEGYLLPEKFKEMDKMLKKTKFLK